MPLYVAKENLRDLMASPKVDGWVAKSAAEGPEKDAFAERAYQGLIEMGRERSYMQQDGSWLSPTQELLYFTATKP